MPWDPNRDGLTPEVAERIIVRDPAMGGRCRRCTFKVGLYTFTLGWYSQCPNCLKQRIESLLAEGVPLEGELAFTLQSVSRDVERQERLMFGELTLEMPRFFRCDRCDALKLMKEARYYVPPGENSSPPYCADCSQLLRSQDARHEA